MPDRLSWTRLPDTASWTAQEPNERVLYAIGPSPHGGWELRVIVDRKARLLGYFGSVIQAQEWVEAQRTK